MPVAVGAQGAATLAELAPGLSLEDARHDDAAVRDSSTSPPRDGVDQPGFSAAEVISPIPVTSSVTLEPTYVRRADGTFNAYVKLKPVLVVESGLPFFTRIEWPIPDVDNENGPTRAGVGDLTWLTLFLVEGSKQWGALGLGPVFVFPTASHSEMGDGKYQVGPALGYVNKAVKGWQFALLLQQYFSVAGDPQRSRVNQLTLQPFVNWLLPGSWYVETQPVITLDFAKGTSSVPLNLVVGKVSRGPVECQPAGDGVSAMDVAPLQRLPAQTQRGLPLPGVVLEAVAEGGGDVDPGASDGVASSAERRGAPEPGWCRRRR